MPTGLHCMMANGRNQWADVGVHVLSEAPRRYVLLKGKRILVTGAEGFIGTHLTEALVEEDARVLVLCQHSSFMHRGWLEALPGLR